ncbi:MAG: HNH endonuclease [Hyphomicrobiaceae bacterium]|jgi:5-methylcytosine-specific restriction endonuclease McrA
MEGEPPNGLPALDPAARVYPASWRDAAIRRLFDPALNGIRCPGCDGVLAGRRGLSALQADHIVPWSRAGQTTWSNLQLLCRACNIRKSNRV